MVHLAIIPKTKCSGPLDKHQGIWRAPFESAHFFFRLSNAIIDIFMYIFFVQEFFYGRYLSIHVS